VVAAAKDIGAITSKFGIGGAGYPPTQQDESGSWPAGDAARHGSTIFLDFNKSLPDLTPDELKQLLSPFLNFARERSARCNGSYWFTTPTERHSQGAVVEQGSSLALRPNT